MEPIDVLMQIDQEISDFLGSQWDFTTPCNINGVCVMLTETQVRWLQVKANRAYKEGGQEAFDEFCKKHKVFALTKDAQSIYAMEFRTDGKFKNEFERPFYDLNCKLTFELF